MRKNPQFMNELHSIALEFFLVLCCAKDALRFLQPFLDRGSTRKLQVVFLPLLSSLHTRSEFARQTICIILKPIEVNGIVHISIKCSCSKKSNNYSSPAFQIDKPRTVPQDQVVLLHNNQCLALVLPHIHLTRISN